MASTGTDDLTLTPHGGGGGDSAEQQQGDSNAGGAERTPVGQAEGGDKPKAAEWDSSLLAVITKKELFRSMHFIQMGIEKLFENAGPIGRHHFASRRQTVDGKTVMLGDTTGEDRVKAVTALADQVIAAMGEGAAVNREAAISTLFSLTTELCPEAVKGAIADSTGERAPADRTVDVERNLQANRALAAAFATEAAGAARKAVAHGAELAHLARTLGTHSASSWLTCRHGTSSRADRVSTGVAAATARVAAFSWAETADIPDAESGCEAVSTPPGTWAVEGAAGGNRPGLRHMVCDGRSHRRGHRLSLLATMALRGGAEWERRRKASNGDEWRRTEASTGDERRRKAGAEGRALGIGAPLERLSRDLGAGTEGGRRERIKRRGRLRHCHLGPRSITLGQGRRGQAVWAASGPGVGIKGAH